MLAPRQVPFGKHLHGTVPNAFGVWKLPAASSKSSTSLRQGCKLQKHWERTEGPRERTGYLKMVTDLKPQHTPGACSQKCQVSVRAQKNFNSEEVRSKSLSFKICLVCFLHGQSVCSPGIRAPQNRWFLLGLLGNTKSNRSSA